MALSCKRCADLEDRLRNKIRALENQSTHFRLRIECFKQASLWERLIMAWKGEV